MVQADDRVDGFECRSAEQTGQPVALLGRLGVSIEHEGQFEPSPTDDLHLVLLMKDILRTLRA